MSSAVNNLGTFDPSQYKNNGTGGKPNQRMAGDYLSEFTNQNANANDKKDKNKSFSYQGNNGKSYGTNTEKMLFGNTSAPAAGTTNNTGPKPQGSNTVANDGGLPAQTTSSVDYGQYTPKAMAKNDLRYAENQAIINSYKGPSNINEIGGNGSDYNANLMAYLGHQQAVSTNKKFDAMRLTHESLAAGNDHGSGDFKAPQAKEYYSYLDTYDGPKTYKDAVALAQRNNPVTESNPKTLDWGKEEVAMFKKYYKDQEDFKAGWGGVSIEEQRGWS